MKLFRLLLSVVLGFLSNYYIFEPILIRMYNGIESIYVFIYILSLMIQVISFYTMITLIIDHQIHRYQYYLIVCCYVLMMSALLFLRPMSDTRKMNLVIGFNYDTGVVNDFLELMMNIFLFFPFGYLLRKRNIFVALMISTMVVVTIESLQYVLQRGVFDINDIIINLLAILFASIIVRMLKLEIPIDIRSKEQ